MKGAFEQKENEIKNMEILHKLDKDKAVERVREQG